MTSQLPPPPPEWAPQSSVWIGWPSDPALWEDDLAPAQQDVAALARIIAQSGQRVDLVSGSETAAAAAAKALASEPKVRIHTFEMGDIWLRDTGPVLSYQKGRLTARRFAFNGWGGKYELPGDDTVGQSIAEAAGADIIAQDAVLEGGAVDWDGAGNLITTRQCLLNPNRNAGWDEQTAERFLKRALGADQVIWLGNGLINDHTDGHVDNLARFIGPRTIVCQSPSDGDPHAEILIRVEADLRAARGVDDQAFEIVTVPSPGRVTDHDGAIVPASHMNFLITNALVIVPIYGTRSADAAVKALATCFPTRRVVGLPARHILTGGGAFHCITQQQPAPRDARSEGDAP